MDLSLPVKECLTVDVILSAPFCFGKTAVIGFQNEALPVFNTDDVNFLIHEDSSLSSFSKYNKMEDSLKDTKYFTLT